MTYVMEMSTDQDIINTQLDQAWYPIQKRYNWAEVNSGQNIAGGATIVVVAHGSGYVIGNANPGTIDIDAELFLRYIEYNVAALPEAVYISLYAQTIAIEFAAGVTRAADRRPYPNPPPKIFAHQDPIVGPVAPPNGEWYQIYPR